MKKEVFALLEIRHIGNHNILPLFQVIRSSDMSCSVPIMIADPANIELKGYEGKGLLHHMRWYLEEFLELPLGAYCDLAQCIQETVKNWGKQCFASLFLGEARDWFNEERAKGLNTLRIKIVSDNPAILAWPWEALYNDDDGYLAQRCCIERHPMTIGQPLPLSPRLRQDQINILYIIARPKGEDDVGYQTLARPVIDYIQSNHLPVRVHVLRPPTFKQLRNTLYDKPDYYHIVHFDGHGQYQAKCKENYETIPMPSQGMLIFEDEDNEPYSVDAEKLGRLLAEYRIPIVILNACESAMIDSTASDPFASVATSLLRGGVRSVVAMGYNLYVSGAKEFVPAFYSRLFKSGNVSEAIRSGRQEMYINSKRTCFIGEYPLQDWLVPVLYQQITENETVLKPLSKSEKHEKTNSLPEEFKILGDYQFIGRESMIQSLERAFIRQKQAGILIHGMAGVGKTTLAREFIRWLEYTNGIKHPPFWFQFSQIYSVEYMINELVPVIVGESYVNLPYAEKLAMLIQQLRSKEYIIVWDNFESLSVKESSVINFSDEEKKSKIKEILKQLRGGKTKIIITSRSPEDWLSVQECFSLPLTGMRGEEVWEYCSHVVGDLGLRVQRDKAEYRTLINMLDGNPLAIRAVMLRLRDTTLEQLLKELQSEFAGLPGDDGTLQLEAALRIFEHGIDKKFLPALQFMGLHQHYISKAVMHGSLVGTMDQSATDYIDEFLKIMCDAGFCNEVERNDTYQLHPVLHSFLLKRYPAPERMIIGFVINISFHTNAYDLFDLPRRRLYYSRQMSNCYYAMDVASELNREDTIINFVEIVANYLLDSYNYTQAKYLLEYLIEIAQRLERADTEEKASSKLGSIMQQEGDFAKAELLYKKAVELNTDERGKGKYYRNLGSLARIQDHLADAYEYYQNALTVYKHLDDACQLAIISYSISNISQDRNDYTVAKSYCMEALDSIAEQFGSVEDEYLSHEINSPEDMFKKMVGLNSQLHLQENRAHIRYLLGLISTWLEEYDAAESWFEMALRHYECEDMALDANETYFRMGLLYARQNQYERATTFYQKALKFFVKEKNFKFIVAQIYNALGRAALDQRDTTMAEAWHMKALSINGQDYEAAVAYNQLGRVKHEKKDYTKALMYYEKSIAIKELLNSESGLAITYANLGTTERALHHFQKAKGWFLKALQIFENKMDTRRVALVNNDIGDLYVDENEFEIGSKHYYHALIMYMNINDHEKCLEVAKKIVRLMNLSDEPVRATLRKMWDYHKLPQSLLKKVESIYHIELTSEDA